LFVGFEGLSWSFYGSVDIEWSQERNLLTPSFSKSPISMFGRSLRDSSKCATSKKSGGGSALCMSVALIVNSVEGLLEKIFDEQVVGKRTPDDLWRIRIFCAVTQNADCTTSAG